MSGEPVRLGDALREYAARLVEQAEQAEAAALAFRDQAVAHARTARSQLGCLRCYGDYRLDRWWLSLGEGPCTCGLACSRAWCLAARDGGLP